MSNLFSNEQESQGPECLGPEWHEGTGQELIAPRSAFRKGIRRMDDTRTQKEGDDQVNLIRDASDYLLSAINHRYDELEEVMYRRTKAIERNLEHAVGNMIDKAVIEMKTTAEEYEALRSKELSKEHHLAEHRIAEIELKLTEMGKQDDSGPVSSKTLERCLMLEQQVDGLRHIIEDMSITDDKIMSDRRNLLLDSPSDSHLSYQVPEDGFLEPADPCATPQNLTSSALSGPSTEDKEYTSTEEPAIPFQSELNDFVTTSSPSPTPFLSSISNQFSMLLRKNATKLTIVLLAVGMMCILQRLHTRSRAKYTLSDMYFGDIYISNELRRKLRNMHYL